MGARFRAGSTSPFHPQASGARLVAADAEASGSVAGASGQADGLSGKGGANDIQPDDAAQWPPYPYNRWPAKQRRRLIDLAVTQWNYLGPNGVDAEEIERAYRSGILDEFTPR